MSVNSNRRINIFINGEEVENKIAGVKAAFKTLNREIEQCTIGSAEYNEKTADIKKLNGIIEDHKKGLKNIADGWLASAEAMAVGMISAQGIMNLFSKVKGMFVSGIDAAIEYEAQIHKLSFALNGNADATQRMTEFATSMSKTSLFSRSKILEAETMALSLGKNEDMAKKMTKAAMALSKIDPEMDLNKAMSYLNGTFGGTTKQIERLVPEIKGLTGVQYASGEAIDIILEKYGRFAHEGLEATEGKMIMFNKSWTALKRNMASFAVDTIGNIVVGFTNLTSSMNEYLQVPASEKMEKERIEVNSLVISLKDQNLTSDVRNKIYNKLKDLSPAILEGIDKENISTSILTDNLNKYNAETIKKIALKTKEEELVKVGKKYSEAMSEVMDKEKRMSDKILEYETNVAKSKIKIRQDEALTLKSQYDKGTLDITAYYDKIQHLSDITVGTNDKADRDFIASNLKKANEELKQAEEANKKIIEDVANFRTRLGIIEISDEQKLINAKDKNAKHVLELRKKGIPELTKLMQEETDILEKALIAQAIKDIKASEKNAKKREKNIEEENKLKLDAMEEGEKKELAKEEERHRKELETHKDDNYILEQEELTHQKNVERIKQGFADKKHGFMQGLIGDGDETDKENQRYQKAIKEYNQYTKDKRILEDEDVAAWESILSTHKVNIDKINTKAYEKELKSLDLASQTSLSELKQKNAEELMSTDTLEKAKILLHDKYGETNLGKFKTLDAAKKELEIQQNDAEIVLQEANIKKLMSVIQTSLQSGIMTGVSANMTPEARQKLQEDMNALMKLWDDIERKKKDGNKSDDKLLNDKKVDVMGFSPEDWNLFFERLKKGKDLVGLITMSVDVLKNAWTSYSNLLTASENKKNRELETSDNKEKTALKTKLDKHLITQAAYDLKVKALDDNLQKQKDTATYNQALRDARLNEVNAIQSAAVASIAIWKYGPVVAIPMEILIAATLAASLATIEANMPSPPAYAEGGFTNGDQIYRAGEKGQEFIASNSLLRDSKTAPVIKWLDQYQRGGKSIPMPIEANFIGMQTAVETRSNSNFSDPEVKGLLVKLYNSNLEGRDELKLLNKYLSNPDNRKARLVRDELTKFDNEMAVLQSLAKIR